jgi:hypothetical protein
LPVGPGLSVSAERPVKAERTEGNLNAFEPN